MKASNLFLSQRIELNLEPNEFLKKAGFVLNSFNSQKIMIFPPLGSIFLNKLEKIISSVLLENEILPFKLPPIQPFDLWKQSGRKKDFSDKVVYLKGKTFGKDKFICSPTNEEVITNFAIKNIESYRNLPLNIYQFDTKIRDDGSSRRGLIRTNIFPVVEGYSLNENEKSLKESFEKFRDSFEKILNLLEITHYPLEKREGYITFVANSKKGDTKISHCKCSTKIYNPLEKKCNQCGEDYKTQLGLELGCLMSEKDNYSKVMDSNYISSKGQKSNIFMGTYGLGLTRLLYTIIEQKKDKIGINWPKIIRPAEVMIIPFRNSQEYLNECAIIENDLKIKGIETIIDDTTGRFVKKLERADIIGIPNKIIPMLGNKKGGIIQYRGETFLKNKTIKDYNKIYSSLI